MFDENLERTKRHLQEYFVHGEEAERLRSYIRENLQHTIIINLEIRLVEFVIDLVSALSGKPVALILL